MALGIGRLFDTVRDAVVVAEVATGQVTLWNPAAARLFGWSAAEMEGKSLEVIIPPRFQERHRAGMERYRRTGHGNIIDAGSPVLVPAVRRDGSEIEVELMLSPIGEDHVVAILRDVTDRQRREEELRRANADLEAFSYVVSHDLKEPVRALGFYLDTLREQHAGGMSPESRALLEKAEDAAERLRRQLTRLLEFARVSRADLPRIPLDVDALLRNEGCRALYADLASERGASVLVEPDIPRVTGDADTLGQALGNVIGNAIRHNPSTPPVVRVRGEARGDEVVVSVEDNGPGFSEAVLKSFAQKGAAPEGGPRGGFGLAIARRAIERQGGRMTLENGNGGAVVRFFLPRH